MLDKKENVVWRIPKNGLIERKWRKKYTTIIEDSYLSIDYNQILILCVHKIFLCKLPDSLLKKKSIFNVFWGRFLSEVCNVNLCEFSFSVNWKDKKNVIYYYYCCYYNKYKRCFLIIKFCTPNKILILIYTCVSVKKILSLFEMSFLFVLFFVFQIQICKILGCFR